MESYETPDPDHNLVAPLPKDHVHELVRCTANALASDELVWLSMLDWSLSQTTGRVSHSLRSVGISCADKNAESRVHQFVWNAVSRLVEQLSAFMRQEDKVGYHLRYCWFCFMIATMSVCLGIHACLCYCVQWLHLSLDNQDSHDCNELLSLLFIHSFFVQLMPPLFLF